MSTGQCRTDPPTGIAGTIYSGWISANGNALASGITVAASTLRNLLASQIEAVAAGIDGSVNNHALNITWSLGTSSGNYKQGAAASGGTFSSVVGCDEGGTVTMTTGTNTSTGALWTVYFGTGYSVAPAGTVQAADSDTAHVMFTVETYVTTTKSGLTLNVASPLSNATYKWHWLTKGCAS